MIRTCCSPPLTIGWWSSRGPGSSCWRFGGPNGFLLVSSASSSKVAARWLSEVQNEANVCTNLNHPERSQKTLSKCLDNLRRGSKHNAGPSCPLKWKVIVCLLVLCPSKDTFHKQVCEGKKSNWWYVFCHFLWCTTQTFAVAFFWQFKFPLPQTFSTSSNAPNFDFALLAAAHGVTDMTLRLSYQS